MPEGDTVYQVARRLHEGLAGRTLTRTDFRVPQLATADLAGREIVGVVARGKHVLTRIGADLTLHTHLRMDGRWDLYRPGQRWRGGPTWQVRVVLETAEWHAVGFRLPVVELFRRVEESSELSYLGPDLLGADWDLDEAVRRVAAAPERTIGEALLDQRNLAGVGNLYRAEVCFLAGVSPWLPVRDVTGLAALLDTAHRLLTANRDRPGQVTTGDPRRGRRHWVFERTGRPCQRCGTRIVSGMLGKPPYERITYWCPRCQPTPSARSPAD